jgi:hypothetical protein
MTRMAVGVGVSFDRMKRVSSKVSRLVVALISPLATLFMTFKHSLWYSALLSMACMSVVESRKVGGLLCVQGMYLTL